MTQGRPRTTAGIITVTKLRATAAGGWLTENWPRGEGCFQVRKLRSKQFIYYYRDTDSRGKQQRITLPRYTDTGRPVSLADARASAKALARRHMAGEKDLKEALREEQLTQRRAREAAEEARRLDEARQSATLGCLLEAYCQHLHDQGKSSASQVRYSVRRHVKVAFPQLWNKPAADIRPAELTPLLRLMVDNGILRQANKVRSYIRAAYSAACNAPLNAHAPDSLRQLGITQNPARDLAVVEGAINTHDYVLTVQQLQAFWRRLDSTPGHGAAIIRFYLLTGGQRFQQLARATTDDIQDGCLMLQDPKGRRSTPRRHIVPLLPEALKAMKQIAPNRIGPYLITLNGGESPTDNSATMPHMKRVVNEMLEAGEVEKPFSYGVLRRTVETRLAALGVSSDIRAQLQSHGLGGVQSRHYDRHDYLREKRIALEKLRDLMTGKSAAVSYLTNTASDSGDIGERQKLLYTTG